jgi:hydrogenase maturation factor
MCFAIPLRVITSKDTLLEMEDGRLVNSKMVGKVKKGDWLLVQSNLAVEKLTKKDAQLMRSAIKEVSNELKFS